MRTVIVGGGASGLIAALTSAKCGYSTTLLEAQGRVGRKLSVTGNGRCNMTNIHADSSHYHGSDAGFILPAMSELDSRLVIDLFYKMGLVTVIEGDGRVYPLSNQASAVVDMLRFSCDCAGVTTVTGCKVNKIRPQGDCGFSLLTDSGEYRADKVAVCCGGAAGEKYGGGASGYRLLKELGHKSTELYPSLVQIKTENSLVRALKGVRADAAIAIKSGGRTVAESSGEVQFTDYGLSGPAVFDVSRAVSTGKGDFIELDFLRGMSIEGVENLLTEKKRSFPELTNENILTGIVHNRLGRTIVKYCSLGANTKLCDVTSSDIRALSHAVKCFRLKLSGTMGFDSAQVTAGGIRTSEFKPETLESRLVPGLYAAGELLDVDGDCGGYNLQWAWASGYLAGQFR